MKSGPSGSQQIGSVGGNKDIIILTFLECSCKISRYFAIKGWKDWPFDRPFDRLRAGSGAS